MASWRLALLLAAQAAICPATDAAELPTLERLKALAGQQEAPQAPRVDPPAGIGVVIEQKDLESPVTIRMVIAGSPSEAAGLRAGDVFVAIDGAAAETMTLDEVSGKLKGPRCSDVTVIVRRADPSTGKAVLLVKTLTRDDIWLPGVEPGPAVTPEELLTKLASANRQLAVMLGGLDLSSTPAQGLALIGGSARHANEITQLGLQFLEKFQEVREYAARTGEAQQAADAVAVHMNNILDVANFEIAAMNVNATRAALQWPPGERHSDAALADAVLTAAENNALRAYDEVVKLANVYLDFLLNKGASGAWDRRGYPASVGAYPARGRIIRKNLQLEAADAAAPAAFKESMTRILALCPFADPETR